MSPWLARVAEYFLGFGTRYDHEALLVFQTNKHVRLVNGRCCRYMRGRKVLALYCFFPLCHSDLSLCFLFFFFVFSFLVEWKGRFGKGTVQYTQWTIVLISAVFILLLMLHCFLIGISCLFDSSAAWSEGCLWPIPWRFGSTGLFAILMIRLVLCVFWQGGSIR